MNDLPESVIPELLILTDLDDSLFSTLRKIPEHLRENATLAAQGANTVAGKDSYMTARQSAMVKWMDLRRCVPVTARGTEAYSRVALSFGGPAAIVANGAVMLDKDGTVNAVYAAHVTTILQPLQEQLLQLPEIMQQLAAQRSLDIRSWTVMEPSCGAAYAVAKCNVNTDGAGLDGLLDDIKAHFINGTARKAGVSTNAVADNRADDPAEGRDDNRADNCDDSCDNNCDDSCDDSCDDNCADNWADNWRFHINGNNLSLTPAGISKAIATAWLLETLRKDKELVTIGVGDSSSDLEFMRLCDAWLTPTGSQIDQMLL